MHSLVAMATCGGGDFSYMNKVQLMIGYMGHTYLVLAKDNMLFVTI